MSTIKSKQKYCQHLTPYRLHSLSQNLEEAEQLHCSVGGSRSFGTGEQCKSAAAQTRLFYAVSSVRLTFPTLSPPLGLPAGTASVKGHPPLLLCWPGPHSSPEGQQPVEGAGLAAALPSREAVQLSHHGTLGSRRSKGNILQ